MAAMYNSRGHLVENGQLRDLKAKDGTYLTAAEVAEYVRLVQLRTLSDHNEVPVLVVEDFRGDPSGLKVNVIGGPTGAGKTSLINILAGGEPTDPKMSSDTKSPTVFILTIDGNQYALLDTAGLCDTEANASDDKTAGGELQELLINAVAATVKRFNLVLVSFLMCVDLNGRLPGNFGDVWPQMQVALGGEALNQYCQFVLTKANGETDRERRLLANQKSTTGSVYNQLAHHQLGWGVVLAGLGNVKELVARMQTATAQIEGIGSGMVNENAESLDRVQENAKQLERLMNDMKASANAKAETKDEIFKWILAQKELLADARVKLERHRDDCTGDEAEKAQKAINNANAKITSLQSQDLSNKEALKAAQQSMNEYQKRVEEEMKKLKEMKSFGASFKSLCGNIASAAAGLSGTGVKSR